MMQVPATQALFLVLFFLCHEKTPKLQEYYKNYLKLRLNLVFFCCFFFCLFYVTTVTYISLCSFIICAFLVTAMHV